jgi:hypothetical protein
MILQGIFFLCVVFFIAVVFYKQRRESTELLQSEFGNSQDSLKELFEERQPIILRTTPTPQSLALEQLTKMIRLYDFPLRDKKATLREYMAKPSLQGTVGIPLMSVQASQLLAKELALEIWVANVLQGMIQDMGGAFSVIYSQTVRTMLGGAGMQRATSVMTMILPVEGKYTVSLVNKKSEQFLPTAWKYRYPRTLTINDSPLVSEIQYIDIVLRPGTMLCLPTHCIFSIEAEDPATFHSALWIEIDSPISSLTKFLEDLTEEGMP